MLKIIVFYKESYERLDVIVASIEAGEEHPIWDIKLGICLMVVPYQFDINQAHQGKVTHIEMMTPPPTKKISPFLYADVNVLAVENCQDDKWFSALLSAFKGSSTLYLKKNHRIFAEVIPYRDYKKTLSALAAQQVLAAQQEKERLAKLPPKAADACIGSQVAVAKAQEKRFEGWQKLSDKGLALPCSSTAWAAIQEQKRGLMWAVNHPDYEHLSMSSRIFVSPQGAYAYVDRANKEAWCGYQDWRLPTIDELLGLVTTSTDTHATNVASLPLSFSSYVQGIKANRKPQITPKMKERQASLAEQSPYYQKPSTVCMRADLFNDIPHNDGQRRLDTYDVWASDLGMSNKGVAKKAGAVSFAHEPKERVSFNMRLAYVRLVRTY